MPRFKRRRFGRKRKGFKKMKRTLRKVNSIVRGIDSLNNEITAVGTTAITTGWVGSTNTTVIGTSGTVLALTTLGNGDAPQERVGNKVQFIRLQGNIIFRRAPSYTFTNVDHPAQKLRLMLIRVKQVPGTFGAHTSPAGEDIFQVNSTFNEGDMYCALNVDQQISAQGRNYDVMFDKAFMMPYSTAAGCSDIKSTHCVFKPKYKFGRHPDICGMADQWVFTYDVNVERYGQSTYDDVDNALTACSQNHYLLLFYVDYAYSTVNQVQYQYNVQTTYRTLD